MVEPLEIKTRDHEYLIVNHNVFNDRESVSIRTHFTTEDDDTIKPTRKGVNIKYGEQLDQIIAKLQELQAAHGGSDD